MTKTVLYAVLLGFAILVVAATSHSSADSSTPSLPSPTPPTNAALEPITGSAATPDPGDESPPRDPFSPYDIGPGNAAWSYSQLTPGEKAVADKGRDTTGWDQVNSAYGNAVAQRAHQAAADSAAAQLGVDNLAGQGVVP